MYRQDASTTIWPYTPLSFRPPSSLEAQRLKIFLMQMVILLHEEHIGYGKEKHNTNHITPMSKDCVGDNVNHDERDDQLQEHIERAHYHMTHPQLIRHQLIRMLAVRLTKPLVQHDTVDDSQTAVHAIHDEQHHPRHVPCLHNQAFDTEQQDKGHPYAPHIPGKTLRLALGTEIENAEHQHPNDCHDQVRRLDKLLNCWSSEGSTKLA